MNDVSWASAAIVGVVFVWAGVSKLQARGQWQLQARDMGAPAWAAMPLPFLELVLGAALTIGWWPMLIVPAALALLASFTALLVRNLLAGRRPACACFGARVARPISWFSVARNLVFMALLLVALLVA